MALSMHSMKNESDGSSVTVLKIRSPRKDVSMSLCRDRAWPGMSILNGDLLSA